MTVCVNGIDVSYTRAGQGSDVLFLHGWGVGHKVYTALIGRLARFHTVYAPDLPGFGDTPEPPQVWDARDYADFVLAFAKALGLNFTAAVGHSNGGRILLQLTAASGNALGVEKLVIIAGAGLKVRREPSYYVKVYSFKAAKLFLRPFPRALERFRKNRGSEDYRSASPLMRGTMSRLLKTDYTKELDKIAVPTLLIWGSEDTSAPYSHAKIMRTRIPDAGLVTLPGGHWAFAEQFPVTAAALDSFLGGKA